AVARPYQVPVSPAQYRPGMPPPVQIPPASGNGGRAGRVGAYVDVKQQAAWRQKAHVLIEINGQIVGEGKLDKPVLTVGRLSGNDIQVPSQRVSRLHAKIQWENYAWVIEDA